MDDRDVIISVKTTPAQLRNLASLLESHQTVRVNWYHTQFVYTNKEKVSDDSRMPIQPPDSVEAI